MSHFPHQRMESAMERFQEPRQTNLFVPESPLPATTLKAIVPLCCGADHGSDDIDLPANRAHRRRR